jgi:spermidine synthase
MHKKLLSYLFPIKIFEQKSIISKNLEITYNNGKLVMDSENTNYSYGSLQKILRKALVFVKFESVQKMNHILVLGVAGGSVIKTLVDEVKFKNKITGIEIDAEIIKLANTHFNLNQIQNLQIKIANAFDFVLKTNLKYDLIIIDVFQDTKMPSFLFESFFINRLENILEKNGFVIFNTMILNHRDEVRNLEYVNYLNSKNTYKISKLPRIAKHNEVIIFQKK